MFQGLVRKGKAQGVLAYADGYPVGWATFGPRTDFPRLEAAKAYAVQDFTEVWSLPCFFIPSGFRNKGIARGLLAAAIQSAKKRKAKILEGYPVPLTKAGKKLPAAWSWTGPLKIFEEAGFKIVQRQSYSRPLVRIEL
jgi:GNAT superfamily N-acetyltransferase